MVLLQLEDQNITRFIKICDKLYDQISSQGGPRTGLSHDELTAAAVRGQAEGAEERVQFAEEFFIACAALQPAGLNIYLFSLRYFFLVVKMKQLQD